MASGSWIPAWARRHADVLDIAAGVAVALAVVAISLVQWGVSDTGWTRGVTLGAALGVVVAFAVRRDRLRRAARERAHAEQRVQLARELHDAVASQVSIIGIQAAAARRVLRADTAAAAGALEAIEVAARTANADLRRMLATLRTGSAPSSAPGLGDLEALVDDYRSQGLEVELDGGELPTDVPAALGSTAYRVVQEALANALAHAGRVKARVSVSVTDSVLRLAVANQPGRPNTMYRGSGLGLQGMRERVELYGGSLTAGTGPTGEFLVDVAIPVRQ